MASLKFLCPLPWALLRFSQTKLAGKNRAPFTLDVNCNLFRKRKDAAHMMMTDDVLATLEKIDQQIVRLIADRRDMIAQVPGGFTADQEMEIMSLWVDEAVERELDEGAMEKMGKMLNQICRKRGE
jgi:hypothetical protein